MFDIKHFLPRAKIYGVDISLYCKKNALISVKKNIKVANCQKLPFKNNYFDLVLSISTIHNCTLNGIIKSIKEINRVTKNNSFIRVKAHDSKLEKKIIDSWNLVAKSNLSKKNWINIFKKYNYKGDYDFSKF